MSTQPEVQDVAAESKLCTEPNVVHMHYTFMLLLAMFSEDIHIYKRMHLRAVYLCMEEQCVFRCIVHGCMFTYYIKVDFYYMSRHHVIVL